jgi:hypothetical protein
MIIIKSGILSLMRNRRPLIYRPYVIGDSDAQTLVTNGSITSDIHKQAIDETIIYLKNNSVWTPVPAYWFFVGASTNAHKLNAKDPRDADDAYRLIFHGSIIHSDTGALPSGSSGCYAETFYNPTTIETLGSGSMGYYSRTNEVSGTQFDMGAGESSGTKQSALQLGNSSNLIAGDIHSVNPGGTDQVTATNAGRARKMTIVSRTTTTRVDLYLNGSNLANNTGTVTSKVNLPVYLFAINYDGADSGNCVRECAGAFIGPGLTSTQVGHINTAFNNMNTMLGRAV